MTEDSPTLFSLFKDLLPIITLILGALLSSRLSRSAEDRRNERSMRVQAYSDYLQSIGETEAASNDPAQQPAAAGRAIAAKARVCAYGSAQVVQALSLFEGAPGTALTDEKKKHLLDFIAAVRTDTGAQGTELPELAIEKILFRNQ